MLITHCCFNCLLFLQRMKKWIVYILSFYILFNIAVPCSLFDKCEKEWRTEQSSGKEQKKDCNNCSPFCVLSPAYNFTINIISISIDPVTLDSSTLYNSYSFSIISNYYQSFFQPPKAC